MLYKWICIDGIDGCGKSTLIENLKTLYNDPELYYGKAYNISFDTCPYKNRDKIKELLNKSVDEKSSENKIDISLNGLIFEDHVMHAKNIKIEKDFAEDTKIGREMSRYGNIRISDRSILSYLVYQSDGSLTSMKRMAEALKTAMPILPDKIIVLDQKPYISNYLITKRENEKNIKRESVESMDKLIAYSARFDLAIEALKGIGVEIEKRNSFFEDRNVDGTLYSNDIERLKIASRLYSITMLNDIVNFY